MTITQTRPTTLVQHDATRRAARDVLVVIHGLAVAVLVSFRGPAPWPAMRAFTVTSITAAILSPTLRRHPRVQNIVALAFGTAGLIAAATIGVQQLLISPWSTASLAGTIAIASGLSMLATSAVRLLRRSRVRTKLLALPATVIGFACLASPLMLAVYVTNPPAYPLGAKTPTDIGLSYEEVTTTTADGVHLHGWYIPGSNRAAVILLGGATGARDAQLVHAQVLARHDYSILMLDVRGHGGSGGDAMLWGWWGELDIRSAVDYLTSRSDIDPNRIAAVGMSMGAEEAIAAAGVDHRLTAIVAEGASARGARDEGQPANGFGGAYARYFDWLTRTAASAMTSAPTPTPLIDSTRTLTDQQVLVIAAGTQPPEIVAAQAMQQAEPDHVTVWIVPGATHTHAYQADPAEWEQRVTDFLNESLHLRP